MNAELIKLAQQVALRQVQLTMLEFIGLTLNVENIKEIIRLSETKLFNEKESEKV